LDFSYDYDCYGVRVNASLKVLLVVTPAPPDKTGESLRRFAWFYCFRQMYKSVEAPENPQESTILANEYFRASAG
jgi:hypothetical protein